MKHTQEETVVETNGSNSDTSSPKNGAMRKWLARFGIAGFLFFFIKGLVWLAVIFGVGKCVL